MSAPAETTPAPNSSPFDLPAPLWLRLWIAVSILFAGLFYLSFCFEHSILQVGGEVWGFFRHLFRGVI